MKDSDTRTVVIGLDGAHFELLQPWISEGRLPNIKQIIETGVSGDLESVIPPVTSPNWKAYATGKNPGKLGLFWWENIDVENQSVYYPDERKHTHTEYWELLARDERVGVIGVPTTYPPKASGEFLVAGAPDGKNTGFTHPESLESELKDRYNYQVVADHKITEQREKAAEELLNLINLRFHVGRDLFEEHNLSFLQLTTFYINVLQHYFWNRKYTRRAWECIDEHIGYFLEEDHNVVLMSDHGSTRIEYSFHINSWLESQGYLSTDPGISQTLHRLGLTTSRLGYIASRLRLRNAAVSIIPDRFIRRIPGESGEVSKSGKAAAIDWTDTRVIASGQGPVYLTDDPGANRFESLRTEVISKLDTLNTPDEKPIADAVHRVEDIYSGPYIDEAPSVLIEQRDGIHIPGDVGRDSVFTKPSDDDWLGENKRHGLFAATGPDFTSGDIVGLSILDLAPTLLHLFNRPVPSDMDGEVRRTLFAEGTESHNREVEYTPGDHISDHKTVRDRDSDVSERLEDLGYL